MDWRHVVQTITPVRSKNQVPVKASTMLYYLISIFYKRGISANKDRGVDTAVLRCGGAIPKTRGVICEETCSNDTFRTTLYPPHW